MMIVVPAFPVGQQGDEPVVPAVLIRLVVPIAPAVCYRVDGPGDVPDEYRADDDSPDENTQTKMQGRFAGSGPDPARQETETQDEQGMRSVDQ